MSSTHLDTTIEASDAPVAEPTVIVDEKERSLFRSVVWSPLGFPCALWLTLVALVAVFGRFITPYDPDATDPRNALTPPFQGGHLLGTDDAGRDLFSRLLVGTQNSMLAVLICVAVALLLGVTAGLIAGYFQGWFDQVANWIGGLIMAMPALIVLLAARTVAGPSIKVAMVILGVIVSPVFYRLVSVTVRNMRDELYVDAARVAGLSDARIIRRHVLRVVRGPIIIQTAIVASISIGVMAGLTILGFGDISTTDWSLLLASGLELMFRQQWNLLWPSLAIGFTTLALTLLGNLLRDELEGGRRPTRRSKSSRSGPPSTVTRSPNETIVHGADLSAEALLAVRDLVVTYPSPVGHIDVVRGVDLDVRRGEVLGLVGESGSGKTQTAFAILGLLGVGGSVRAGSISFDGRELVGDERAVSQVRGRCIAYVPQEPMSNLDPSFTIGSQLVEPLRVTLGLSKRAARQRALELLEQVEISDPQRVFDSYPHQISGGMAQRILIAGALASEPDLIIADEPTTALDVTVQAEILELLRSLQRESGTSLLLVSHDLGVIADLADRIAVMQSGRIVETGAVGSVMADPQHPYTQSLLDAVLDHQPPRAPYCPSTAAMSGVTE